MTSSGAAALWLSAATKPICSRIQDDAQTSRAAFSEPLNAGTGWRPPREPHPKPLQTQIQLLRGAIKTPTSRSCSRESPGPGSACRGPRCSCLASIQQNGECGGTAGPRKRREAARAPDAAGTCTQSALPHILACWPDLAARSEAVGAAPGWVGPPLLHRRRCTLPAHAACRGRLLLSIAQQDAMPAGRGPDKAAEE